ncbi:ATP5 (YDR298C) [Zygosaccharomyces parabailii]|uniref:ATP synthase subunit 5, mitochondrial n=1 Tax=Zygosaccharomyces bailii (strain CLIB 213 / ATCC 58445 / CBS 680 / BCRC 21525 / NBRC 1098 / NCYC 1416 / NRRL Y-2227) TaxID=1333698 RepID=A0A8J2T6H5_ZYGB2|nr:ATP5 (YDR298C) [Zygosaccharomyces parabailii]CDF89199.1 ZYBA0S03-11474g1_1 [Zygosaccharomyces bailii CLIB 213]CDH16291.1 probable ATP synthase subunit 5, mitochondrial [Zygosaccharomyces bailii ISA1307]
MFGRIFTRSLATASKGVKPPVQLFGLDGTYATALFTAASKNTSIQSASSSLSGLSKLIESDPKLKEIVTNPSLPSQDRTVIVDTLCTEKLDGTVANLLKVLAENNRLDILPKISTQFTVLTDAYNGLVKATVISAQPLDSKSFKRIEKAVAQSSLVGSSKTLKLVNDVRPEIQGGLIVELGDKTVDLSVAAKLQKLNKALEEYI